MIQTIREAAMKMASLSIYRGILRRTVPKAFYQLLLSGARCAETRALQDQTAFLEAWGAFFSALCQRDSSQCFARCLTQTALFDENAFSLAAAGGQPLSQPLKQAARRDLSIILELSQLSPEFLMEESRMGNLGLALPKWETGAPEELFQLEEEACLHSLWEYYRCSGCGMYARYRAFIWRDKQILPVAHPDPQRLCELKGYETPRSMAVENTVAFLKGLPANNCLLYGDRGTGKSSTVKALLNEYYTQGLRVIEMPKEYLMDFPYLVDQIAGVPMKFIIFIDDLSFSQEDSTYAALKSVLQGGLAATPKNALIYATSNRRHLIRETWNDRTDMEHHGDIHRSDTVEEKLSLAARFGVSINFGAPTPKEYQEIVLTLARRAGITMDSKKLLSRANAWEVRRGGFSGRAARQFVDYLAAQPDS